MPETANDVQAAEANLRPSEVADALGVSTATLRRWSRRFEDFLRLDGPNDGGSHRRYTSADLDTLQQVKTLLDQGWTYDQAADHLRNGRTGHAGDPEANDSATPPATAAFLNGAAGEDEPDGPETTAEAGPLQEHPADDWDDGIDQVDPEDIEEAGLPAEVRPSASQFLREALQPFSDTQQIILNAQQATRDLVGVMIQDNLNLKDENLSLRERMLELERELAEIRRRQADYRERMETRVRILEDAVSALMAQRQQPQSPATPARYQPPPPAARPPEPQKRSFWARLIGG